MQNLAEREFTAFFLVLMQGCLHVYIDIYLDFCPDARFANCTSCFNQMAYSVCEEAYSTAEDNLSDTNTPHKHAPVNAVPVPSVGLTTDISTLDHAKVIDLTGPAATLKGPSAASGTKCLSSIRWTSDRSTRLLTFPRVHERDALFSLRLKRNAEHTQ